MPFDFQQNIILEDGGAKLMPLENAHVDYLVDVTENDPDLLLYAPSPIRSYDDLVSYVGAALEARQKKIRYPLAILDKKANKWAGSTSFANVSNKDKRLEIGWTWLGKAFHRTGLNRHVKYLMLSYAFQKIGFNRVELKTDARNKQSRKAIMGIGAQYEGTLRSHMLMSDGYRRDTVYYSILASEWPQIKKTIFEGCA